MMNPNPGNNSRRSSSRTSALESRSITATKEIKGDCSRHVTLSQEGADQVSKIAVGKGAVQLRKIAVGKGAVIRLKVRNVQGAPAQVAEARSLNQSIKVDSNSSRVIGMLQGIQR